MGIPIPLLFRTLHPEEQRDQDARGAIKRDLPAALAVQWRGDAEDAASGSRAR